MNLLGLLFLQYKDGKADTFASRWMDWHGRVFLGKPEDKGMDWVREDLRTSYYKIAPDRVLPTERKELRQWEEQSMFVAQFRNFEAPVAAKVASMVCLVLALGFVGLGGVFDGTAKAGSVLSSKASQLFGGRNEDSTSEQAVLAWCKEIKQKAPTMSPEEQLAVLDDPRVPQCEALFKANP